MEEMCGKYSRGAARGILISVLSIMGKNVIKIVDKHNSVS